MKKLLQLLTLSLGFATITPALQANTESQGVIAGTGAVLSHVGNGVVATGGFAVKLGGDIATATGTAVNTTIDTACSVIENRQKVGQLAVIVAAGVGVYTVSDWMARKVTQYLKKRKKRSGFFGSIANGLEYTAGSIVYGATAAFVVATGYGLLNHNSYISQSVDMA